MFSDFPRVTKLLYAFVAHYTLFHTSISIFVTYRRYSYKFIVVFKINLNKKQFERKYDVLIYICKQLFILSVTLESIQLLRFIQ